VDGLSGYSRALYSNWLWYHPSQLLIDAGEGLPLALGLNVFRIAVIALTHGHSDHLLGLPGFVGARRFGKGAPLKPYTVLYPDGSTGVDAIRRTIGDLWRGVEFPITWIPLLPGSTHSLGANRSLHAFSVTHVASEPSFGYRLLERRRRLRPEFANEPQHEVERMARRLGRDHVMEDYAHVVLAHSGDAMPVEAALVTNADVLVHDATFLDPSDRREPIHASSPEVFELAREAHVRAVVLNHLSIRYDRARAVPTLRAQVASSGFTGEAWLLDEASFVNLR
jgi:ribonuclease Z